MESTVAQRLVLFIYTMGESQISFSKKTHIPQSSVATIISRDTGLNSSIIEKIKIAFPILSLDWLISGEGNMLINLNDIELEEGEELNPELNSRILTRPRIPCTASAGSLTSAVDGITEMECEQIPVITAFPSYDYTIIVKGDSMYPNYEGGDEVACKRIDSTSFIQWGKVHVLDTAQGIVIKRVYDDGGNVKCVSYNKEYPDFTINKEEVYSMSLVVGMLRL